ncbi:hypothetical protein Tco_0276289 [Tanacetum coccineum]
MTTARTRAVVNTGKGKMYTDLKKSRWVWRPKGNYLDHVSKDSGSFMLKKILLHDHGSGCIKLLEERSVVLRALERMICYRLDFKASVPSGVHKIRSCRFIRKDKGPTQRIHTAIHYNLSDKESVKDVSPLPLAHEKLRKFPKDNKIAAKAKDDVSRQALKKKEENCISKEGSSGYQTNPGDPTTAVQGQKGRFKKASSAQPAFPTSFVEQFWTTAKSRTVNNISYIDATVAGKPVTISEASIRSDLLFDDADGIDSLNNQLYR